MSDEEHPNALQELQGRRNWEAAFALSKVMSERKHLPSVLVVMCEALLHQGDPDNFSEYLSVLGVLCPDVPEASRSRAFQAERLEDCQVVISSWRRYFGQETNRPGTVSQVAKVRELAMVLHIRRKQRTPPIEGGGKRHKPLGSSRS